MLFDDDIEFINADTCYIVSIIDEKQIERRDLKLNTGEHLKVGDGFTQLGSDGCSYRQPIKVADGWVQFYQGVVPVSMDDGAVSFIALFSAKHTESGACALEGREMKFTNKYLAYASYDDGGLGYFGSNYGYHFFDTDLLVRATGNDAAAMNEKAA